MLIFQEHLFQGTPFTDFQLLTVQDWYVIHVIFHGLHILSSLLFLLPLNKYTCFQKYVHYLPLRTLSRLGKSQTVTSLCPTYLHFLPYLIGNKSDITFPYFLPNDWVIGFFLVLKGYNFPRKSNFVLICKMVPKIWRFV